MFNKPLFVFGIYFTQKIYTFSFYIALVWKSMISRISLSDLVDFWSCCTCRSHGTDCDDSCFTLGAWWHVTPIVGGVSTNSKWLAENFPKAGLNSIVDTNVYSNIIGESLPYIIANGLRIWAGGVCCSEDIVAVQDGVPFVLRDTIWHLLHTSAYVRLGRGSAVISILCSKRIFIPLMGAKNLVTAEKKE